MSDEIEITDPDDTPVPVEPDGEEEELELPLVYDEEEENLCEAFMASPKGAEWLKKACSRVKEDWDREWEATSQYRERVARDLKILSGDIPRQKDAPYSFSANAHVPIMIRSIVRTVTRASGELFGDWQNVFGVVPVGPDDEKIAEILTIHGNWQLREQIPDFKRQLGDRGLMAFFVIGDVRGRSYYNTRSRLNCHEILTPDDFLTPYTHVTTSPNFSDLPWYALKLQRYRHELEAEANIWYDVPGLFAKHKPRLSDEPGSPLEEEMSIVQGHEPDDQASAAPYKLIWWEGWISIPPSEDTEEGELGALEEATEEKEELAPRQRFVQLVIDYQTEKPLKLAIHEMPNWQERERFRMQTAELQAFRAAQQQHQAMMLQHQQQLFELQAEITALETSGQFAPEYLQPARDKLAAMSTAPLPPPPQAPSWLEDPEDPMAAPEPMRKEPILLFSHAVCIEPLVGNLGLSYGRQEADINRAANTLLSQFIDSATLANIQTFLVGGGIATKGPLKIKPGQFNFIKELPGNLKESLMPLAFAPANPQLFELTNLMMKFGEEVMDAPQVLSGQPGKSGETYRGIAARIEQATKQLSVITGKYADFLTQILKNNALLNSLFLREEEVYMVANHLTGQAQEIRVGRQMYERNYLFTIRSDLRFTTQAQKIGEADEIVKMSMEVPVLQREPDFQYVAVKKALEARGRSDLVQAMGKPPSVKAAEAQAKQAAMAQAGMAPPPGMQPPGPPGGPPRPPARPRPPMARTPGGQPIPGAPGQAAPQRPPQPQPSGAT